MMVSRAPQLPSATIVAFDGVVADTLALRARALDDALAALVDRLQWSELLQSTDSHRVIAGRTFAEAARALLSLHFPEPSGDMPPLETIVDLVAVDAGRRYAAALSNGISLRPEVPQLLSDLAASGRLVARADSARRDVEAMLALSGLDATFAFVRCSDDAPRKAGASSIESSWLAMDHRLLAIAVPVANRTAIELSDVGLDAARPFAAEVSRPRFEDGSAG